VFSDSCASSPPPAIPIHSQPLQYSFFLIWHGVFLCLQVMDSSVLLALAMGLHHHGTQHHARLLRSTRFSYTGECVVLYPVVFLLSQMTRFHSFHGWMALHCVFIPHFLYPLVDRHLGCSPLLAAVNRVWRWECRCLFDTAFISSGYVPSSKIISFLFLTF
jgi:hypothetical protein